MRKGIERGEAMQRLPSYSLPLDNHHDLCGNHLRLSGDTCVVKGLP